MIGPRFDLPGFIRFVAAQAFLGDTDGFLGAFGMNNFYLYRLENQDKHVLIAWDTDNTFWGPTFPIRPDDTNVLMQKLMRIPEYNALWYAEIARADADGGGRRLARRRDHPQRAADRRPRCARTPTSRTRTTASRARPARCCRSRASASRYVKCALAQGDRACGG